MRPLAPRPRPFFSAQSRVWTVLGGGIIVLATLAAYRGSFSGPFLLDDVPGIVNNPSIRSLSRLWPVLSPPPDLTTSGRPLVNLSLAINYALGGTGVWGYHAANLAIHIFASLALFGIVRRTLLRRALGGPTAAAQNSPATAAMLAFAIALIWALHPLQTAAVTYVIQRAESMMGLFYLLTLYCFIRGTEGPGVRNQGTIASDHSVPVRRPPASVFWLFASVFSCLLGMATKEVMVSAPVMVLLYDRVFIAGTFGQAWRRRKWFYVGLAATWVLLAWLVASVGGNRNGSVGFGLGLNWWAYELTQFQAVARYFWLSIWPHPLVFDYGPFAIKHASQVLLPAAVVLLVAAGTVISLRRRPALGYAGLWFFAILAPTSVMPGPSDMIDEHRMYLALAAVVAVLVVGVHALLERAQRNALMRQAVSAGLLFAVAVPLGLLTARRNRDYRSELSIWTDTVAKRPDNAAAHDSLGNALEHAGRLDDAIAEHNRALQLLDFAQAHYNLGNVLAKEGRFAEAMAQYELALHLRPDQADTHDNLANALLQTGRIQEALEQYGQALRLNPADAHAHYGLGMALIRTGRTAEALEHFQKALQFETNDASLQDRIGTALAQAGRMDEAVEHFAEALRIDPHNVTAHVNLGIALAELGRTAEAVSHYEETLRIDPNSAEARVNLANVRFQQGRMAEAVEQYQAALRIKPDYADAHYNLGMALIRMNRLTEAAGQFQQLLRLNPNDTQARNILDRLQAGRAAPAFQK